MLKEKSILFISFYSAPKNNKVVSRLFTYGADLYHTLKLNPLLYTTYYEAVSVDAMMLTLAAKHKHTQHIRGSHVFRKFSFENEK